MFPWREFCDLAPSILKKSIPVPVATILCQFRGPYQLTKFPANSESGHLTTWHNIQMVLYC